MSSLTYKPCGRYEEPSDEPLKHARVVCDLPKLFQSPVNLGLGYISRIIQHNAINLTMFLVLYEQTRHTAGIRFIQ